MPRPLPGDGELVAALRAVALGPLVERLGGNLDAVADWASVLSLGEQQRLAFARVLLARPQLVGLGGSGGPGGALLWGLLAGGGCCWRVPAGCGSVW